jgi:hypothetical protein
MQYRRTTSGRIYRRHGNTNEVLTPWGWTLTVFMPGKSGWALLVRMSEPVEVNPDWPA